MISLIWVPYCPQFGSHIVPNLDSILSLILGPYWLCDRFDHLQKTMETVEADLRREVCDLRERLMMGAEEYKAKYLECRKLLKSLKKAGGSWCY